MLICDEDRTVLIATYAEDYLKPGATLILADWRPSAGDVVGGFGGAASSMEASTELAAPGVDADPELLPGRFLTLQ